MHVLIFTNRSISSNHISEGGQLHSENMAETEKMWQTLVAFLLFCSFTTAKEKAIPIQLTEETWQNILEGEWLVKL